MIAPARRAAYEVVRRVFAEEAYADRALASAVAGLDDRDRALAQRLAYGTVQRARTIDYGIEQLGKRPVRKLDPPVIASLRLGAYQLGWTDQSVHAVTDDAVELVRAAGLERAVPFTNAVMRRLAHGFRGLVASLPEGPLKHSYPDWIADVWERDFGRDEALALMRAQNEPPALEVRAAEPVGEPTDIPGAYVVERVDPARMRRDEPRVAARRRSSSARSPASGSSTRCAAPGGKTAMLAGDVTAVEVHAGRAEALARDSAPNVRVVNVDLRELGGERLRPRARRCALLGPRRSRAAARPALAVAAAAGAAARAPARGGRAREAGRHDRLLRLHDERRRERGGRRRVGPRALEPLGEEWPRYAHPRRPEFLLDAAAPRPHCRVLHRPVESQVVGSKLMPWRQWIRTVEVEPSLYAADFSIIGEQIEVLLRAGCRVFHFDVGDGHFVEPITMGPIVLQSISPLIHRFEGAVDVHLMVEKPSKYFESIAAAGGDSATFHFEAVDDVAGDDPRGARARAAGRGRVQSRDRARAGRRGGGGGRPRALHGDPSRLLGPAVPAGDAATGCAGCVRRCRKRCSSRSTAASRSTTSARSTTRVCGCWSRARRSSSSRICRAPTAGSSKQLA